jgi:mannose-1-phosphate guanylyltransferase
MLPLVGVPMIECVLEWLAVTVSPTRCSRSAICRIRFTEAYPSNVIAGVRVTYAVEPEPLDTAGAIRFAADEADVDETFLVVNGDVVTDLDVTKRLEFHRSHEAAKPRSRCIRWRTPRTFGVVPTSLDGRVIAFVEKPPRDEAPTNQINAGTYVFEPRARSHRPEGRVSVERETFPALAAAGELFAMVDESYWLDTGTPQHYLQANVDILKGFEHACTSFTRTSSTVRGVDSSATIDSRRR